MAYKVYDISAFSVDDYPYYYFDANVWIAALKSYGIGGVTSNEIPYQTFVEAVVNLNEEHDSKAIKRIKHKPKIILTSLVLSEIINSFMRNIGMKAFFGGGDEYKRYNYKNDYRDNPTSDYRSQLKNLCSDLSSFSDYTEIRDDEFAKLNPFDWISQLPSLDADFNDLYYYNYLKGKDIPLITHDRDFKFHDIIIITANRSLLSLT